jgi:hypothetical protein
MANNNTKAKRHLTRKERSNMFKNSNPRNKSNKNGKVAAPRKSWKTEAPVGPTKPAEIG